MTAQITAIFTIISSHIVIQSWGSLASLRSHVAPSTKTLTGAHLPDVLIGASPIEPDPAKQLSIEAVLAPNPDAGHVLVLL